MFYGQKIILFVLKGPSLYCALILRPSLVHRTDPKSELCLNPILLLCIVPHLMLYNWYFLPFITELYVLDCIGQLFFSVIL